MDPAHFSGVVERRDLGRMDEPSGTALEVSFPAGARTHWHRHAGGQVLYVVEGRARVALRDAEPMVLEPGDLVATPPNEEHWHGAATDAGATHLALSFGETEWLEPVT